MWANTPPELGCARLPIMRVTSKGNFLGATRFIIATASLNLERSGTRVFVCRGVGFFVGSFVRERCVHVCGVCSCVRGRASERVGSVCVPRCLSEYRHASSPRRAEACGISCVCLHPISPFLVPRRLCRPPSPQPSPVCLLVLQLAGSGQQHSENDAMIEISVPHRFHQVGREDGGGGLGVLQCCAS